MAEQHTYDVNIDGETYTVASPTELSDAQAYQYAKSQVPFDVKKQNAVMRANMAKQPEGTGVEDTLASFANAGPMKNFGDAMDAAGRGEGAKAVHQAVVGSSKVLAPAALPFLGTPAGVAALITAVPAALAGDVIARKAASVVTDNPDYQDVAGDVGSLAGGVAGGKVGSSLEGPVLRFAGNVLSNPKPIRSQLGDAIINFADRDAAAARIKDAAITAGEKIVADTKDAQHAEAIRTNKRLIADAKAKATAPVKGVKPSLAQVKADEEAARLAQHGVVPVADAVASNPAVAAGAARTAITGPIGQTAAEAATAEELNSPVLAQMRARMRELSPPVDVNVTEGALPPGRGNTPTHEQTGAGARGNESPSIMDLSKVPNGKNARPGARDLENVDASIGPNASGESAASKEALSRAEGMKARGEEFVVKKGNTMRKLVGPDAVDYTPVEGETFGIRDKDGNFRPLSEGEIKHALSGNRKAGSMPIAMRRALFNALNKRSGQ